MKKEMKQRFPEFDDKAKVDLNDEVTQAKMSPNAYLKNIDSSFENFFYQRDYSVKNFNFYLQVLAQ
jgi:hypothetical protein